MLKTMYKHTHKHHILVGIFTFVLLISLVLLPILSTPNINKAQDKTPDKFINLVNNNLIISSNISSYSTLSSSSAFVSLSSISSSSQINSIIPEIPKSKIIEQVKPVFVQPIKPIIVEKIEPQNNFKKVIVAQKKPVLKEIPKPIPQNIIEIKPTPQTVSKPIALAPKIEPAIDNSYIATDCNQNPTNQMLELVNNHRATNGAKKLTLSGQLGGIACAHSKWMTTSGIFSHTGRDNTNPFERCKRAGTYCKAENVAYNSIPNVQDLFDQFKNSEGHNINMVDPNFVEIGIAFDGIYVTQIFR